MEGYNDLKMELHRKNQHDNNQDHFPSKIKYILRLGFSTEKTNNNNHEHILKVKNIFIDTKLKNICIIIFFFF